MVEIYIDPKVAAVRQLHSELLSKAHHDLTIHERLSWQARTLLDAHQAGNDAVTFHLGSWSPDFVGVDSAQIMRSSLSLSQTQKTIAREYGYGNWSDVEALKNTLPDEEFERAVDAVITGDISQVQDQLQVNPALVHQRSQYGHRACLLHYMGANGVESHRQVTPLNAPQMMRVLILGGADVNAKADMYEGSTALNLVLSSAHPHNAGVSEEMAKLLRNAGAA